MQSSIDPKNQFTLNNLERLMIVSRKYVIFVLLCLLSTGILWHSFAATLSTATHDDGSTQILLILPISLTLILSEWKSLKSKAWPDAWTGASLFAVGILIAISAKWSSGRFAPDVRVALGMLALVILWIAAFVLCLGAKVARYLLFPLCFLFWMVPIPSFALARIVQWLQQGSAFSAWLLFSAAGVPASRDGVLVYIPGLTVQVASECSSIRSSLMLLVTTMVLAHALLRTPWRKVLLILLAVPISVAKNGVRIFTLSMLGTRVDRSFLTGRLHRDGGILFFVLALAAIAMLLRLLRRNEEESAFVPRLSSATPNVLLRSSIDSSSNTYS
jgi:exosortase